MLNDRENNFYLKFPVIIVTFMNLVNQGVPLFVITGYFKVCSIHSNKFHIKVIRI